jgi:acetaldehyde dehydrogenase (acetylating)
MEPGTIITPAARDCALEYGISLKYREPGFTKSSTGVQAERTCEPGCETSGNAFHHDSGKTSRKDVREKFFPGGPFSVETQPAGAGFMTMDNDLLSVQGARELINKAKAAQQVLASFDHEQVDRIIRSMVKAAADNAYRLAVLANSETGFGKVEDKAFKNRLASEALYSYIRDMRTTGIIREDNERKIIEIAEPVGVIAGIVPSTNPTSTVIYKSIISLKSRNGIVFTPHPSAAKCTIEAAKLMNEAAVAGGAPDGIVSCLSRVTMEATNELMKHPGISMILATGGSAMVKAAYSSGKPALGVGSGNVPAFIERSADIGKAVRNIILSKTFDNGTICASEQAVITEECIRDKVIEEFNKQGAYFLNKEELAKVAAKLFLHNHAMNSQLVGRSPQVIAEKAGIKIPEKTTVLIGEQQGVGKEYPLSCEKLTTVLGFYTVKDWEEACELSIKLINNGGVGHSMVIHSEDRNVIMQFSRKPVFRILVNVPSAQGAVGAVTGLAPALTLGCGTWGGSSTSDNVTPLHLINRKRIAFATKEMPAGETSGNELPDANQSLSKEDMELIVQRIVAAIKKQGWT